MSKYFYGIALTAGILCVPVAYKVDHLETQLADTKQQLKTTLESNTHLEQLNERLKTDNETFIEEIEQLTTDQERLIHENEQLKDEVKKMSDINAQLENKLTSRASSSVISLSSWELDLLERLVEAEAGAESLSGRMAVAQVVINRVNSPTFPNTLKGVIYQANQFEPVAIGTIDTKTPSETTKEAVKRVLRGEKVIGSDILYFWARYVPKSHPIWQSCPIVTSIGAHHFSNKWN